MGPVAIRKQSGFGCARKAPPPETRPAADFKTIQEETAAYKISVKYPVTGNPAVNAALEEFVKGQVDDFKKGAGESSFGMKNELKISYEVFSFSDSIRSFKFDVMSYTGGAHPNTAIVTKTYDLQSGKEIGLNEIFNPNSDYLKTVSKIASADLIGKIKNTDAKWVQKGAGPAPENYARFVLSENEIVFFFDPYQVAPYSEGPQEAKIPYSALKGLLQPSFEK